MQVEQGTVKLKRVFSQLVDHIYTALPKSKAQMEWGDRRKDWSMCFDGFSLDVNEVGVCRFEPVGDSRFIDVYIVHIYARI